jgi:hypothetical protein
MNDTVVTAAAAKRRAKSNADGVKAATENTKVVEMTPEEEAAIVAAQVAAAKRDTALSVVSASLTGHVAELRVKEGASAKEVRMLWIAIGRDLIKGRDLFTTESGSTNNKGFNAWIVDNKIDKAITDRNQRTHAMWLAEVFDTNKELFDLIPSEGVNVKRSPTTIQRWYIEELTSLFQVANDMGVDVPEKSDDAAAKQAASTNLFGWAEKHAETLSPESRAVHDFRVDIARATSPEVLTDYFLRFKPKSSPTKFADRDVQDAAAYLLELLITHGEPVAVYEAIKAKLDDRLAAMTEKAKADDEIDAEDEDEGSYGDEAEAEDDDFDFDDEDEGDFEDEDNK